MNLFTYRSAVNWGFYFRRFCDGQWIMYLGHRGIGRSR